MASQLTVVRWLLNGFLIFGAALLVVVVMQRVDRDVAWDWIGSSNILQPTAIIGSCMLLASSWAIFWLRDEYPRGYGALEVVVGTIVVMLRASLEPHGARTR